VDDFKVTWKNGLRYEDFDCPHCGSRFHWEGFNGEEKTVGIMLGDIIGSATKLAHVTCQTCHKCCGCSGPTGEQ
jgi:hypothetical protein